MDDFKRFERLGGCTFYMAVYEGEIELMTDDSSDAYSFANKKNASDYEFVASEMDIDTDHMSPGTADALDFAVGFEGGSCYVEEVYVPGIDEFEDDDEDGEFTEPMTAHEKYEEFFSTDYVTDKNDTFDWDTLEYEMSRFLDSSK